MEDSNKIWYKRWWGLLVVSIFALILFFLATSAFYFIGEIKNAKLRLSQAEPNRQSALTARFAETSARRASELTPTGQTYQAANEGSYWLGSPKAKITIVEFGDFACPACAKAFPTTRELSLKYKDDIKFIWRDYPVIADYSAALALAGRCAGEQGLFWPMHDKLFQNQGIDSTDQITALANQIGTDQIKFKDCLDKQRYLPQIQKDLTDGQSFSITGTPTYFINGYKLAGDVPLDIFVKIIEELKKN